MGTHVLPLGEKQTLDLFIDLPEAQQISCDSGPY